MGALLKWVGIVWAVIGIGNVVLGANKLSETGFGFSLIFNMVLFVLPGLLLAGIGSRLQAKPAVPPVAAATAPSSSIEDRLGELDALRSRNLITEDEYKRKRQDLLQAL